MGVDSQDSLRRIVPILREHSDRFLHLLQHLHHHTQLYLQVVHLDPRARVQVGELVEGVLMIED